MRCSRCKVRCHCWVWRTLLLALASTNVVFANPKFNPRKEQRLVSEEHEQWLTLQRQQLPYVDDPADATSLKLVQVLFRHGARTPLGGFPTDPNANYDYGVKGYGQLTPEGKLQALELGQYLRKRYAGYFEPDYSMDEVYTQSSDTDRTIMTAQLCLAGLFPGKSAVPHRHRREIFQGREEAEKTKDSAQPRLESIPVRAIPNAIDNKISGGRGGWACPKLDELFKEAMNTPKMLKLMKEKEWMVGYLRDKTGVADIIDFDKMVKIGDTLQIEDLNHLRLPPWTTKVYPENLQEILNLCLNTNTSTPQLSRLTIGPLLAELVQNMEMRVRSGAAAPAGSWTPEDLRFYHFRPAKAYFFGGHDLSIASVLNALWLYDGEQPAYTSALILELHASGNSSVEDDYFIQLFYKKGRSEPITEIDLPKCPTPCTLASFKEAYHKLILGDGEWEKECHIYSL